MEALGTLVRYSGPLVSFLEISTSIVGGGFSFKCGLFRVLLTRHVPREADETRGGCRRGRRPAACHRGWVRAGRRAHAALDRGSRQRQRGAARLGRHHADAEGARRVRGTAVDGASGGARPPPAGGCRERPAGTGLGRRTGAAEPRDGDPPATHPTPHLGKLSHPAFGANFDRRRNGLLSVTGPAVVSAPPDPC